MFASGALQFAFEKATTEGKITILALFVLSLFSWTIIITKFRQLYLARKWAKRFFAAYSSTRDPLDIKRRGDVFGARPPISFISAGPTNWIITSNRIPCIINGQKRISPASFDAVKVALEEAAAAAGDVVGEGDDCAFHGGGGRAVHRSVGDGLGRHGNICRHRRANSASLTAMAPGVAGALIATVTGLLVAIPAMFAYNFMVTTIRAITQELDGFATRYATQIEHVYVDNRELEDKIASAIKRPSKTETSAALVE